METFRARFCSTTDTLRLNKWPIDLKEPVDSFKMVVKEPFLFFLVILGLLWKHWKTRGKICRRLLRFVDSISSFFSLLRYNRSQMLSSFREHFLQMAGN